MKMLTAIISWLAVVFLFCGCASDAGEIGTNWTPPMKGLTWGMPMEEALQNLDEKTYSRLEPQENATAHYIKFTEPQNITYGDYTVSLEGLHLQFDSTHENTPLIGLTGMCKESDIPDLYDTLNNLYGDYATGTYPYDTARWEKGLIRDLPDIDQIMEAFHRQYGESPSFEALSTGFLASSLVRIEFFRTGKQLAGLLSIQAENQVLVDTLR